MNALGKHGIDSVAVAQNDDLITPQSGIEFGTELVFKPSKAWLSRSRAAERPERVLDGTLSR